MAEKTIEREELLDRIDALQQEVSDLRKILMVLANSIGMIEGMEGVTHAYLRRAVAKLESTTSESLKEEYLETDEFTFEIEGGFKLMANRAREMDLTDLADHLEE